MPLMVSLSNHRGVILRQAQDERLVVPLMVSSSNHLGSGPWTGSG